MRTVLAVVLAGVLGAADALASATVMVNTNTGAVQYPTNFATANMLVTTNDWQGSNTVLQAGITNAPTLSQWLASNTVLQASVTTAQGRADAAYEAGTNAQSRVGIMETNTPSLATFNASNTVLQAGLTNAPTLAQFQASNTSHQVTQTNEAQVRADADALLTPLTTFQASNLLHHIAQTSETAIARAAEALLTPLTTFQESNTAHNIAQTNEAGIRAAADAVLSTGKMAAASTAWRLFYSDASKNLQEIPFGLANSYLRSAGVAAAPAFSAVTATATNLSLADLLDIPTNTWMPVGDGTDLIMRSPGYVRTNLTLVPGVDVQAYNANLAVYATNPLAYLLANDGAGSEVDSDTVDGYHAYDFLSVSDFTSHTNRGSPEQLHISAAESNLIQSALQTETLWIAASNKVVYTNDVRMTDARTPLAHDHAWASITNPPTSFTGYGITNADWTGTWQGHSTGDFASANATDVVAQAFRDWTTNSPTMATFNASNEAARIAMTNEAAQREAVNVIATNALDIAQQGTNGVAQLREPHYLTSQPEPYLGNEQVIDGDTLVASNNSVRVADRIEQNIMLLAWEFLRHTGEEAYQLIGHFPCVLTDLSQIDVAATTNAEVADSTYVRNYDGLPGALRFDGTDDLLYTNDVLGLDGRTETVAMWFWSDGFAGPLANLFEVGAGNVGGFNIRLARSGSTYTFQGTDCAVAGFGTTEVSTGEWHHAAIVLNGDGNALLYLDGALSHTYEGTMPTPIPSSLFVVGGSCAWGSFPNELNYFWNGKLDEMVVLNDYAMSAGEIADIALTNRYLTVTSGAYGENITALWHLDEMTGTLALDATAGAGNLTFYGSPTWVEGFVESTGCYDPSAMTLSSTNYPTMYTPATIRVQVDVWPEDGQDLSTSLTGQVSRCGGTNWTTVPLVYAGPGNGAGRQIWAGAVSVTNQPVAHQLRWRYTTSADKIRFYNADGGYAP